MHRHTGAMRRGVWLFLLGVLLAALVGVGIPRYYVLISWATVVALWNYLRRGVPATWAPQREELA